MTQDYDLIDNVERHQYECHITYRHRETVFTPNAPEGH